MQRGTEGDEFISELPQKPDFKAVHAVFVKLRKKQSIITEEHIQHPKFQTFLKKMQSFIPRMVVQQMSDVAIGILYNKPLQKLEITGQIQDALMTKIHEIPIVRLLQLDFIIRKTKSTELFETIQLELQKVFLKKVGHFLCNHKKNICTIDNIAAYMNHHPEIVTADLLKDFSNVLLSIEDYRLKKDSDMLSIIKMYSKFNWLDDQSKNALKKMVKVWINLSLTTNSVEMLLSLISESEKINKDAFEESGLIRFIFNYLDENRDGDVRRCYQHLIKMGYWHQSIDSLSKLFDEESFELDVHIFIQMCYACEKYDYKPSNWEISIFPALQSFDFCSHFDEIENISWPEFVWKLHSLGHCDTKLIETVLATSKFKTSIYIDHLKIIQLKMLIKSLEEIVGSENIMIDYQVDEQRTVPFLLLMNSKTEQFLPITWIRADLRPDEQLIGIIISEGDKEEGELTPIESDGNRVKIIELELSMWNVLPKSYRKSFLLQKINNVVT